MVNRETIHDTIEQAITVLSQTWQYDAWLFASRTEHGWQIEHAASNLDIAVGDVVLGPDNDYPFFEGVVRHPASLTVPFSRNGNRYSIGKIQASLMHPLIDNKGNCFALFIGLAKRGVSRAYEQSLPLLSVIGELIMQSRELLLSQDFAQSQKERALAFAKEDELTGIYNRRGWADIANHIKGQMRRKPTTHGLLLLDINDMKTINDEQGHEAGDSYLVHFSNTVKNRLRDGDVFARLGGDEFAILACNTNEEGMQCLKQDLISCFMKNVINCAIGFSTFSEPEQFEEAMNKADMAMFEHKKTMKKNPPCLHRSVWQSETRRAAVG